jgi:hypothetical protein
MVRKWAYGKRHESWASDTVIFGAIFVGTLALTVVVGIFSGSAGPPAYLIGALGAAGSALFGAASSDRTKRERDVSDTADRAESKADDALTRQATSFDMSMHQVLDVQERELAANKAALRSMLDAVEIKEQNGIAVLPETYTSIASMRHQIGLLTKDIAERRKQIEENTTVPSDMLDRGAE